MLKIVSWVHSLVDLFMGLVYNAPLSSYLFQDNKITQKMWTEGYNATFRSTTPIDEVDLVNRLNKHKVLKLSGKGLLSILFPRDFYYKSGDEVLILDGVLTKGNLEKKHIGPSGESLIHNLYKYYGNERTAQLFYN